MPRCIRFVLKVGFVLGLKFKTAFNTYPTTNLIGYVPNLLRKRAFEFILTIPIKIYRVSYVSLIIAIFSNIPDYILR